MKKIVFAVQVFGIIALFPIYVVFEMNHGTEKSPENMNHPVVKERIEKTIIRASLNAEAQIESAKPVTMIAASRVPVSKSEITKALPQTGTELINN
jgi:hypothetical protein